MTETYRHWIRLRGEGATGSRISGALLRDLLDVLVEGCRGAVRMRVEGRSSAPGPTTDWLAHAADFEILPLEEGSTVLPIETPPLAVSAPERFAQLSFLEVDPSQSGFSLFEQSLDQALRGNEEAELFDQPLLQRFAGLAKVLSDGVEGIEITGEEEWVGEPLTIEPKHLRCVEKLLEKTPPPQRVRVGGTLDTIRHSDRMFSLVLESGESVKGVADTLSAGRLASLFGEDVIVQGRAFFRPSGRVLRVQADTIIPAEGDLGPWSSAPRPIMAGIEQRTLIKEQGPRSGLNAIYGGWPGDESDEQLESALAEMS